MPCLSRGHDEHSLRRDFATCHMYFRGIWVSKVPNAFHVGLYMLLLSGDNTKRFAHVSLRDVNLEHNSKKVGARAS